MADPTQFHQVIMNLCTNAYHAMEKTGHDWHNALSMMNILSYDTFIAGILRALGLLAMALCIVGCGYGLYKKKYIPLK